MKHRDTYILGGVGRKFAGIAALTMLFLFAASGSFAQAAQEDADQNNPITQELKKFPNLVPALGRLFERYQGNVHLPEARGESRLLPLLPESTMYYAALSNYGDFTHQTVSIFRQQLEDDPELRNWWEHGSLAESGPKVLDALDKLGQFEQFLGDETIFSGSVEGQKPSLLFLAEARKPGLKKFLEQLATETGNPSKPPFRVLEPQQLAAADLKRSDSPFLFLIRPDYIVAASDLSTLRSASALLDHHSRQFASVPFGRRIAREYRGGVTAVAGADLQKLLTLLPPSIRQDQAFRRSGFADVEYLVWRRGAAAGQPASQSELSFTAPRHGIAAWLSKPGPLNSLDFASPKAILTLAMLLASPSQIFDDVRSLSASPNTDPAAPLPMEQALKISLKGDLLNLLTGELALEVDSVDPSAPAGRLILGVRDAAHLQRTLTTLLGIAHLQAEDFDDGKLTYHVIRVPSAKAPYEITYTFADGYLVIGSSRDVASDSIRLHLTGQSLAKSPKLPSTSGRGFEASAFMFQDPMSMAALQLRRFAPSLAGAVAPLAGAMPPTILSVFAGDASVRQTSNNGAFDVGAALVVAAIAIPNLLKSKVAANDASAAGSVRTINTAEITYQTMFPQKGYAPNLAALGPDPNKPNAQSSPEHADLVDGALANDSCTGVGWCTKSGYNFKVVARCKLGVCDDYLAVATPVGAETGSRSFCSTADALIHFKMGPPLTAPPTISQCKAWPLLQ